MTKVKKEETNGATTAQSEQGLIPVAELAVEIGLSSWELAGLVRTQGWTDDKAVTQAEFDEALTRFRNRRVGGGR